MTRQAATSNNVSSNIHNKYMNQISESNTKQQCKKAENELITDIDPRYSSYPSSLSLFALRLATPVRAMSGSRLRKRMPPTRSGSTALSTMFVPPHHLCLSARPRVRDRRRLSRTARLRSRRLRFSSRSRRPLPRRRSLRSTTTFTLDGSPPVFSRTIQRRWTRASSGWVLTLTLCSATS